MITKNFRLSSFVLPLLFIVLLSGCGASPTPFAATVPPIQAVSLLPTATPSHTPTATHTPTLTPTPTATYTATPTATLTPTLTFTPSNTPTATYTPTVTPTFTPSATSTPIPTATFANPADDPNYTPPPSWTPPPLNPGATLNDHFQLRRPISRNGTDWVERTYPYGSTSGRRLPTHLGVEFVNPSGTPVLAAGAGTVYYAGDDLARQFGPQVNYYGNVVVIQHDFVSPQGEAIYSLYGHLSRVDVVSGQRVNGGDTVGLVGATGVAYGPHLHFEVRAGNPENYLATRNPELWIYPYGGYGTLAGRVLDASGNIARDVIVQVESASGTRQTPRYAFTYADATVNSDPAFTETFTLGDLPANYYDVTVRLDGRRLFQRVVYIYPNKTTWVDIQLSP